MEAGVFGRATNYGWDGVFTHSLSRHKVTGGGGGGGGGR